MWKDKIDCERAETAMANEHITLNITHLRDFYGCTQKELAAFLGVKTQTVHKWEHDKGIPSVEQIYLMSRYFGVKMEDIIVYDQGKKIRKASNDLYLDKQLTDEIQ